MQPIKPPTIDLPGYAALAVKLPTMVSNVFELYCAGNRRPAFRATVTSSDLSEMQTSVLADPKKWIGLDTMISNPTDAKERIKAMDRALRKMIAALQVPFELVQDIGKTNKTELVNTPGWSQQFFSTPSVGYARSKVTMSAKSLLTKDDSFKLESPTSPFSSAISRALFTMDRGRYTTELIPVVEKVGGHDARSLFGGGFALTDQIEEIASMLLLYAVQGTVLSAWANRRWEETSYQLAWVTEETARVALEARARAKDAIYAIPMHPLISYIANSMQTGRIETYQGDHDITYRTTERPEQPDNTSAMRTGICEEAIRDMVQCEPALWDGDEERQSPISYGELFRLMRTWNRLTDRWPKIASKLGWTNLRGDVGTIVARGADFILTDGLGYSGSPTAAVLGLRPVISIANIKVAGFARRYSSDWNIGEDRIKQSTLVVDGFQGDTCEDAFLERLFLPTGMWMGEDSVQVMYHSAVMQDPIGKRTVHHFSEKSPSGYVGLHYTDSSVEARVGKDSNWIQTAWDGWAVGKDKDEVQTMLLVGYSTTGPNGTTSDVEPMENVQFYHRSRFFHRFIAEISHDGELEWYNAYGQFCELQKFDGNVAFDDQISITTGTGELEAVIQTAPVMSTLGAKLPAGTTEQVTLSE